MLAANSATSPAFELSTGKPSALTGDVPNTQAIAPRVIAMPAEPASSSGLRPNLSMQAMATSVVTMLVKPVIMVISSEFSSEKPTTRQRTLL